MYKRQVWTGDKQSFAAICQGAPIPLLVAGGPSTGDTKQILTMVKQSMEAGGAGVCMGRQIFAHPDVTGITKALTMIVHDGCSVDEAMEKCSL